MPTRNINLTVQQNEFVEEIVESGEYQNASEAIRDAIRALQQRRERHALELERLRAEIDAGLAAHEAGDYIELSGAELRPYLRGIVTRHAKKLRSRKPRKR